MKEITLSIIVAAARNGVIGKDNSLPWHLPEDLRYFKAVTTGKPVVMGRKTFESIGRPLPNRTNIVITRNPEWVAEKVLVVNSLSAAIAEAKKVLSQQDNSAMEVMIIGGAEIYKTALPLADKIYLTWIDRDVDGDAKFPELSPSEWQLISRVSGDPEASEIHEYRIYERKKQAG
jgi:dihydrofolate reductase